jgi:hypothetical protein
MIALVEFLTDQDLIDITINTELLDATRKAAQDEINRRKHYKTITNDV